MRRLGCIIGLLVTFNVTSAMVLFPSITLPQDKLLSWEVYFSPNGGCTDAIVRELDKAKSTVLVQAYSFTSYKIAKGLLDAHKRGIEVAVILDKSQKSDQYSPKRSSWRW